MDAGVVQYAINPERQLTRSRSRVGGRLRPDTRGVNVPSIPHGSAERDRVERARVLWCVSRALAVHDDGISSPQADGEWTSDGSLVPGAVRADHHYGYCEQWRTA